MALNKNCFGFFKLQRIFKIISRIRIVLRQRDKEWHREDFPLGKSQEKEVLFTLPVAFQAIFTDLY